MNTFTNTDYVAADAICRAVNTEYAAGRTVQVNGREVGGWEGSVPATVYMNGTIAVRVRGKTPGKFGIEYVKVDQSANLQFA